MKIIEVFNSKLRTVATHKQGTNAVRHATVSLTDKTVVTMSESNISDTRLFDSTDYSEKWAKTHNVIGIQRVARDSHFYVYYIKRCEKSNLDDYLRHTVGYYTGDQDFDTILDIIKSQFSNKTL